MVVWNGCDREEKKRSSGKKNGLSCPELRAPRKAGVHGFLAESLGCDLLSGNRHRLRKVIIRRLKNQWCARAGLWVPRPVIWCSFAPDTNHLSIASTIQCKGEWRWKHQTYTELLSRSITNSQLIHYRVYIHYADTDGRGLCFCYNKNTIKRKSGYNDSSIRIEIRKYGRIPDFLENRPTPS